MKKKKVIIISIIFVIVIIGILFLSTGKVMTDIILSNFEVSEDGTQLTLHVGVSNSSGYIRKMKRTSGSMNYYYTFYSTFGINSKIGSKDTFTIELDKNVDEIYFYTGNKGYNKVLEKDNTGKWINVSNNNRNIDKLINHIVENGPMQSANPFDYINASKDIYKELLNNPKETFKYSISNLIKTNGNDGLRSYIEALLCSEINTNFEYDFESATDYLEKYKEFLTKCDCLYNDYDNYAISLIK